MPVVVEIHGIINITAKQYNTEIVRVSYSIDIIIVSTLALHRRQQP